MYVRLVATGRLPDRSAPRPVLYWIHGGGFIMGAASQPLYDGEELARLGCVVVSVNYRFGLFGFLSHPALSREDPGGAKTFFIEGVAHGRVETADIVAIVGGEWDFENTIDFNHDGTADIGLVRDNHDGTHSHISYLVGNGHIFGNTDIFLA